MPAAARPAEAPVASTATRAARTALVAGLAAGPAVWLLVPALLRSGSMPGAPSAGIYPLLHRWWAIGGGAPARFPEPGDAPSADLLATLLHPLVAALGVPFVVKGVMLAGLVLTLVLGWRYARRLTGDDWAASAAVAVFAASPAVVAGVTSGDLDAWHGWALLALPLVAGPAALAVGLAIALVAPTMVPAALLPVVYAAWSGEGRARYWPLAGWGLAVGTRMALGWPDNTSNAGREAWFSALTPAVEPERVHQVYVGFAAVGLLALALSAPKVKAAWGWCAIGVTALVFGLVSSRVPPERFLHLVPLAAAIGGLAALRARAPGHIPAAAVWVATLLIAEGWKGVAAPVPLVTATLLDPAPTAELADGPVLDLPATRTAIRRGLWYQTHHGHAIAADVQGNVAADVATLGATLMTGGCMDVAAYGFTNVVARREGALRELGPLRACLGEPAWDDGAVALWRLSPGAGVAGDEAAPR